jgi:hypothetical protein
VGSTAVVQLRPRQQPFQAAVDAYRGARPDECLTILQGHSGLDAAVLRARAALRVGCPEVGIETIETIDDETLPTHRARAEVLILRGALYSRHRDFDRARDTLDDARVFAFGAASAATEAEYHFYEAVHAFAIGDLDGTDQKAQSAFAVERSRFADYGRTFVPIENTLARTLLLRGHVAAAREKYREQLDFVRDAIELADRAESPDLWISASFLMHLAFHVRDFDLVEDAQTLRTRDSKTWPAELNPMKFEIHRALGWSSALRGDHLNAFREFRRMSDYATTSARKVLATVERAYLSRELGESHAAHDAIEYASKLSDTVNWNHVGEERIGLAQLAQEVAAFDPPRAKMLFDRYRAIKSKLSPGLLNAVDRRPRAYEALAEATVLRANGSVPAAAQRFGEAFKIWDSMGYRWRAATAALPLAELLKLPPYTDYVRREAAERPNSWLQRRAAALNA